MFTLIVLHTVFVMLSLIQDRGKMAHRCFQSEYRRWKRREERKEEKTRGGEEEGSREEKRLREE